MVFQKDLDKVVSAEGLGFVLLSAFRAFRNSNVLINRRTELPVVYLRAGGK